MFLLTAIAAAATPSVQARASVRVVLATRVTREEWDCSRRKREILVRDEGRAVRVRLIEFE